MQNKNSAKKKTKKSKAQKLLDEIAAEPKKLPKQEKSEFKLPKFSWKLLSFVLMGLLILSIGFNILKISTGNKMPSDDMAETVSDFIEQNIPGVSVTVVDATIENGLYKIDVILSGPQGNQPLTLYTSIDGELLFPSAISITGSAVQSEQPDQSNQQAQIEVPKSDKPKVELFVMSHCPYGTQAEKGILPVAELLGDKIDFNIKFVSYAMHGVKEIEEQMRQVCIEDEQRDKYFAYLWCFLEDGDSEKCLKEAEIDEAKLSNCVEAVDSNFNITAMYNDKSTWLNGRYPQFNVYKAENDKYGISGSPTLVINGEVVSTNRNPASYLAIICSAFNDPPAECEQQLTTTTPSTGFGLSGAGSNSAHSCG